MSIVKEPICPHLVRSVPESFSWLDHRLVRDRRLERIGHQAAALYLFLVTVGDVRGLSYYSDTRLMQILNMSGAELGFARDELAGAGLAAWKKPLYQVLALEPRRGVSAVGSSGGEAQALSTILRRVAGGYA